MIKLAQGTSKQATPFFFNFSFFLPKVCSEHTGTKSCSFRFEKFPLRLLARKEMTIYLDACKFQEKGLAEKTKPSASNGKKKKSVSRAPSHLFLEMLRLMKNEKVIIPEKVDSNGLYVFQTAVLPVPLAPLSRGLPPLARPLPLFRRA